MVLSLPEGNYQAEWINPSDGIVISRVPTKTNGSKYKLETPGYDIVIPLKIISILLNSLFRDLILERLFPASDLKAFRQ
jgi:hypothetical protein